MATVSVKAPKTPVTKGSATVAVATIPNICKMPGPPAPFVPTPLPNIGQGSKGPHQGYTTSVKIEGQPGAIFGCSFGSMGDIASMGTGGGIISNNAEGPTKFLAPGCLTVMAQSRTIHFLGDQTLNNNGPAGSPPNSAAMAGALHQPLPETVDKLQKACCDCDAEVQPGPMDDCKSLGDKKHSCCEEKLTLEKGIGGERGFNRDGTPFTNGSRKQMAAEGSASHRARISGTAWPDACALDVDGNPAKFFDFKFGCPAGVPVWRKADGTFKVSQKTGQVIVASGLSTPAISKKQEKKYSRLARKLDMEHTRPDPISNRNCP